MSDERLARIETSLGELKVMVQRDLVGVNARLKRVEGHVLGTPEAGVDGMDVRVDRVEQWKARHTKLMWVIVGSVVTLVGSKLFALIGS